MLWLKTMFYGGGPFTCVISTSQITVIQFTSESLLHSFVIKSITIMCYFICDYNGNV